MTPEEVAEAVVRVYLTDTHYVIDLGKYGRWALTTHDFHTGPTERNGAAALQDALRQAVADAINKYLEPE